MRNNVVFPQNYILMYYFNYNQKTRIMLILVITGRQRTLQNSRANLLLVYCMYVYSYAVIRE